MSPLQSVIVLSAMSQHIFQQLVINYVLMFIFNVNETSLDLLYPVPMSPQHQTLIVYLITLI